MCSPVAILTGVQAVAGIGSAISANQEGKATQKYYNYLASNQRRQGDIVKARADKQGELIQDTAKTEGKHLSREQAVFSASQRAQLAANGITGDSVTSEDIIGDTFNRQKADELMLRYNADVRTYEVNEQGKFDRYALRQTANENEMAGSNARQAGRNKMFTTLLGTAATVGTTGLSAGFFKPKQKVR